MSEMTKQNRTRESEFEMPPEGYGVVPFFWWLGDKLTREKLVWQMENLFVDGEQVRNLNEKLRLSKGTHLVVAAFNQAGRTSLMFAKGELEKQEYPLSMKWYGQKDLLPAVTAKTGRAAFLGERVSGFINNRKHASRIFYCHE